MFTNSATLLFICMLGGATLLLILLLILLAVIGKKKPKSKGVGALKALTLVTTIAVSALGVLTPLVYENYIDLNLRYGLFKSESSNATLHVHRHSVSVSLNGASEQGNVGWTLNDNQFSFTYQGTLYTYTVKDMGTKLYVGDQLAYRFTKDGR